jgi:hypothetical protein
MGFYFRVIAFELFGAFFRKRDGSGALFLPFWAKKSGNVQPDHAFFSVVLPKT